MAIELSEEEMRKALFGASVDPVTPTQHYSFWQRVPVGLHEFQSVERRHIRACANHAYGANKVLHSETDLFVINISGYLLCCSYSGQAKPGDHHR